MPTAILIVGLVITVVGLALILLARFERPSTSTGGITTESFIEDVEKVIKAFNDLLDKIEQRFRIGVVVMALGLTLVGVGAFLEAKEAKDDAESAFPSMRP